MAQKKAGRPPKKVLEQNLQMPEDAKKTVPRKMFCCEHCGVQLVTGIVRIAGGQYKLHNAELEPVHNGLRNLNLRPRQRVMCPDCNKITDLCLE